MSLTSTDFLDGLLASRARIKFPPPKVAPAPGSIHYEFGGGRPDPESFPFQDLIKATETVLLEDGRQALTYGTAQGYEGLRELVSYKTQVFEGFSIPIDQMIVTNGSSDALALIADTFLDVGDVVICEAPTFAGSLRTLERHGARMVGVPVDAEGMRTDVLADRLEELRRAGQRPKFIYTIVNFQNPAGPTLTLQRRKELLDLAERYETLVVEDDAYGELRFEGEWVPSLLTLDRNGLVMRMGTVSKILGAGLRLGWVIAAKPVVERMMPQKYSGGTNPFVSRVATEYLRHHLEEHVEELRRIYKGKRDAMLTTLEDELGDSGAIWSRPEGGFFIWMELPPSVDPWRLQAECANRGVGIVPGPSFFPGGQTGEQFVRFAFSYCSEPTIREGTREFAEAFRAARR